MPRPDPPPSALAAATSPDFATRAQAAQQLAPWADREDIAAILSELVLDSGDTFVTESACVALLERGDVHGIQLIARAIVKLEYLTARAAANAEYPVYSSHIDHIYEAVSRHLLPNGPVHEFLNTCNTLGRDPDTDTAAGAAELLQWVRPWA